MNSFRRFMRAACICTLGVLCFISTTAAQAEINAWYVLTDSSGPGNGVINVQQGASGAPLVITTDSAAGVYEFTVRFAANVPVADQMIAYSVNVIAPDDDTITATALSYLTGFMVGHIPVLGSGPGTIIERAEQFDFVAHSGEIELFEFEMQISSPPDGDLEIYSGIGTGVWASFLGGSLDIVYADSDPLDGEAAGFISNTPSIIIRQQAAAQDDCNNNNINDADEIAADSNLDCNTNAILDECEVDDGTVEDCQGDGIPDECQLVGAMDVVFAEGFDDITSLEGDGWVMTNNSEPVGLLSWSQGNDVSAFPAQGGAPTSFIAANFSSAGAQVGGATISNWLITPELAFEDGMALSFHTRVPDGSTFPDRLEVRMSLAGASKDVGATSTSVGDFTVLLVEVNPTLTVGGYPETWTRFESVLTGLGGPTNGRFAFRYYVTNGGPSGDNSDYIGIDTVELARWGDNDCNDNGVPDECDTDCNENGIPDECDIAGGTSTDCDNDGVPDECEADCNENGIPDDCDITGGASADCNTNGVPDECELADGEVQDCNGNGIPDVCDIANGSSIDCNENGIPDDCDVTLGNSADCNTNSVPDECDIAGSTSSDSDGNGIPDECQSNPGAPSPDGGKIIDRNNLRSFLALLFNVPIDGQPTLAFLPLKFFSFYGAPMSALFTFFEVLNLPVRVILFELTYAILDAILP
ncbi:MAG: choice-of-anchor J domain-containing protein [Planctomycetota bacterium]